MTTDESTLQLPEEVARLRDDLERQTGKSTAELYEEREQRLRDAIELREPDRVPVVLGGANFACRYAGVPASSPYYDVATWKQAYRKTILELDPDLYRSSAGTYPGLTLETLDARQMRWPGYNLPADTAFQFIEGEYMKADEYDLFLFDPSDFILRYYLPRAFGALEPLAKLPPLRNYTGSTFTAITPLFATPEFQCLAAALVQAGQEETKWRQEMDAFEDEMAALGFPVYSHSMSGAPFDTVSDYLRGMRGSMIDMYRCPDKLLAACEKLFPQRLASGMAAQQRKRGNPGRVFLPLHRGSEGFMSRQQFETFYWPGLKKVMLALIDQGLVPMPFFEGKCASILEYLLELPKGKVVCHFEQTDMALAKEVLGDHACIMGNVPSALLQVGSATEVEEYCRNLIQVCGKGGGFILTSGSAIDEARPENVKAMVDAVKKYRVN